MKEITVMLVEDHQLVRQGLRSLLESEPDIEVVGEAENGQQAVQLAGTLRPAVVVMGINLPQLDGLEATRRIRQDSPGSKVVILTAHHEDPCVEQAIKAGASGFLPKQTASHKELASAIREITRGNTFISPGLASHLGKKPHHLSPREVEVLRLIADGKANKQVALELVISFKTADKHRQHIMDKLNIHDIAGLTRHAISAGIIKSTTPAALSPHGEPDVAAGDSPRPARFLAQRERRHDSPNPGQSRVEEGPERPRCG